MVAERDEAEPDGALGQGGRFGNLGANTLDGSACGGDVGALAAGGILEEEDVPEADEPNLPMSGVALTGV